MPLSPCPPAGPCWGILAPPPAAVEGCPLPSRMGLGGGSTCTHARVSLCNGFCYCWAGALRGWRGWGGRQLCGEGASVPGSPASSPGLGIGPHPDLGEGEALHPLPAGTPQPWSRIHILPRRGLAGPRQGLAHRLDLGDEEGSRLLQELLAGHGGAGPPPRHGTVHGQCQAVWPQA